MVWNADLYQNEYLLLRILTRSARRNHQLDIHRLGHWSMDERFNNRVCVTSFNHRIEWLGVKANLYSNKNFMNDLGYFEMSGRAVKGFLLHWVMRVECVTRIWMSRLFVQTRKVGFDGWSCTFICHVVIKKKRKQSEQEHISGLNTSLLGLSWWRLEKCVEVNNQNSGEWWERYQLKNSYHTHNRKPNAWFATS